MCHKTIRQTNYIASVTLVNRILLRWIGSWTNNRYVESFGFCTKSIHEGSQWSCAKDVRFEIFFPLVDHHCFIVIVAFLFLVIYIIFSKDNLIRMVCCPKINRMQRKFMLFLFLYVLLSRVILRIPENSQLFEKYFWSLNYTYIHTHAHTHTHTHTHTHAHKQTHTHLHNK